MRVVLGSDNPVKLGALADALAGHPALGGAEIVGAPVGSGVAAQPRGLEETFLGARLRAEAALRLGEIGIGVEDGVFARPEGGAWMNLCVACVARGGARWFGTSSAFEYPAAVARLVVEDGLDVSEALRAAGLTEDVEIGRRGGAIGLLSKGRLTRRVYTRQAIEAALLHLA